MFKTNKLVIAGHPVYVRASIEKLGIYILGNVLTERDMHDIRTLADDMSRSEVQGRKKMDATPTRTSYGTFLDNKRLTNGLIAARHRLSKIAKLPASAMEEMQVLRYEPKQEYKPHFDFFETRTAHGREIVAEHGQRIATMVIYLSEVESGGSTIFPSVHGLQVCPQPGDAVLFMYPNKEKHSLHGGSPVVKGVKWTATQWWTKK